MSSYKHSQAYAVAVPLFEGVLELRREIISLKCIFPISLLWYVQKISPCKMVLNLNLHLREYILPRIFNKYNK